MKALWHTKDGGRYLTMMNTIALNAGLITAVIIVSTLKLVRIYSMDIKSEFKDLVDGDIK